MIHLDGFTERAKKVLMLANQEAQRAGREQVGTEHFLLGLLSEGRGVAAHVLENLGVKLDAARTEIERLTLAGRRGFKRSDAALPLSTGASAVVQRAREESASLNHRYIGTEHLLLALVHERSNVAVQTMINLGLDPDAVRREVVALLSPGETEIAGAAGAIGREQRFRIGIVGVSGYGGGEALRLCAMHPHFQVVYVAGETSAGQSLGSRFPGIPPSLENLTIQKWDAAQVPDVDLLFTSLPTGESREALARIPSKIRIIDLGGDHRFVEGWTYGLADIWPEQVRVATRIANPGCYPAAAILALAPLLANQLIEAQNLIIDAKSGVSGAGRGGGSTLGFAEVNEDLAAYGLLNHSHVPEMNKALSQIAASDVSLTFTPHLIPMTRGLLVTCYARTNATTQQCIESARLFYAQRPFVRVIDHPPHTKWAAGSNLAFVSYVSDPARGIAIALCAIDNLGKGAAGQALQNANLMLGFSETTGLQAAPIWP